VANAYTVAVTNGGGGALSGNSGVLTVVLPPYSITGVSLSSSNIVMSIVSSNSFDTTNAWTLQTNSVVTGPYADDPSPTFTTTGGGNFSVTTTNISNSQMFYRLHHVP